MSIPTVPASSPPLLRCPHCATLAVHPWARSHPDEHKRECVVCGQTWLVARAPAPAPFVDVTPPAPEQLQAAS